MMPEIGNKKGEILKILQEKKFKIINMKTVLFDETDVYEILKAYENEAISKYDNTDEYYNLRMFLKICVRIFFS